MDYQLKVLKNQSNLPLKEILKLIDGENYDWRINCLHAVGILPGSHTMLQLEEEVEAHSAGFPVSWTYITEFAEHVDDIHDLGLSATPKERSRQCAVDNGQSDEIVISVELFDSTFWCFKTNDEAVAKRLSDLK